MAIPKWEEEHISIYHVEGELVLRCCYCKLLNDLIIEVLLLHVTLCAFSAILIHVGIPILASKQVQGTAFTIFKSSYNLRNSSDSIVQSI